MTPDRSPTPALTVEGGVHYQARALLARGINRVGPTVDCDIVVTDLDHAAPCFSLTVADGAVVLEPLGLPVGLRGRSLAPGRTSRCADGARFTCGGIAFRVDTAADGTGAAAPKRRSFGWSVPVTAVGVLLASLLVVLAPSSAAPPVPPLLISAETTASIPVDAHAPVKRTSSATLLQDVGRRLAAANLDTITLAVQPDGAIEARGQITPQQLQSWRDVGRWFDGVAAAGRTVLVDQVHVGADAPPLTVQAVWPGRRPYLIDGGGDKLFVGAILANGWTISGIDATRVLVRRGGQSLAVRF